ncbi:MAG: GtrA family protein [Terrisporobacter sp.]|uniref:GtrA family protein n=1 Tax=Terrisporobacter sp. TaxID=1965305 RepID=UPI002FC81825
MFFKGGITINNNLSQKIKGLSGKIIEYIKFNVVGMINFIISQLFYLTLYIIFNVNYIIAYTITSAISITASYYFNSKYTFKDQNFTFKKYFLSILVYIFEYILNLGAIVTFVHFFNISKAIAPIIAPIFSTIPVFFLMRLVIKNTDRNK